MYLIHYFRINHHKFNFIWSGIKDAGNDYIDTNTFTGAVDPAPANEAFSSMATMEYL